LTYLVSTLEHSLLVHYTRNAIFDREGLGRSLLDFFVTILLLVRETLLNETCVLQLLGDKTDK
jgi:hypothetical protein